jgi:hypothetical protein
MYPIKSSFAQQSLRGKGGTQKHTYAPLLQNELIECIVAQSSSVSYGTSFAKMEVWNAKAHIYSRFASSKGKP